VRGDAPLDGLGEVLPQVDSGAYDHGARTGTPEGELTAVACRVRRGLI
jgi:hypothetical protein